MVHHLVFNLIYCCLCYKNSPLTVTMSCALYKIPIYNPIYSCHLLSKIKFKALLSTNLISAPQNSEMKEINFF